MYINATGKSWFPLPPFVEGNAHVQLVKHSHRLYRNRTPYAFWGDIAVYFSGVYIAAVLAYYAVHRLKDRKTESGK